MNEYIDAFKLMPDEDNNCVRFDLFVIEKGWGVANEFKLVSSFTISLDLLKKFFVPTNELFEDKEYKEEKEVSIDKNGLYR